MTPEQIDFYVLDGAPANGRQLFACRLSEKAYLKGHHVYIHTASQEEAHMLDELLWTFRPASFVPHALSRDAKIEPVVIGCQGDPQRHDILILLGNEVPEFAFDFKRIVEIVTDANRTPARQHYREFKISGYQIQTHQLKFQASPN